MQTRRNFFSLALAPLMREAPFDWSTIPAGQWLRIPANGEAAPKVFHGGAAINPQRGEIYFFGSDTHAPTPLEKGESNAVWRLDYITMTWSQDYEADPKSTYRILPDGQTETTTGRPWAIHTFDALKWDPSVKRMVAVSYPEHTRFDPKKRFPQFKGDWYKHLKPMHWEYEPETKKWTRLDTNAPNLFAQALVWDPDRKQLIGHNGTNTFHFDRAKGQWISYDAPTVPGGWHRTLVYDTFAHRVLLLGNNLSSNVLWSYDPDKHKWEQVHTKGWCLPANGATLAYDTERARMLYLANDSANQYSNPGGKAVTFVYDSEDQYWTRLECPTPALYGMNYLMQYIPGHGSFLHFEKTKESKDRMVIQGFRLP